jgi:hypothetical protein
MVLPDDEAYLLPFPGTVVADGPEPALDYHSYFIVDGCPIHVVGERWRREDAQHSPAPTYPDPLNPKIALTTYALDSAGRVIPAVSFEVFQAYLRLLQGAPADRAAATSAGR